MLTDYASPHTQVPKEGESPAASPLVKAGGTATPSPSGTKTTSGLASAAPVKSPGTKDPKETKLPKPKPVDAGEPKLPKQKPEPKPPATAPPAMSELSASQPTPAEAPPKEKVDERPREEV